MREEAFRASLAHRLGAGSIESYVDYLRRVERELGVDLDTVALDPHGIEALRAALLTRSVPAKSVANCISALRQYARMAARLG